MADEIIKLYPSAHVISIAGDKDKHTAQLRLKCKNKEEFKKWLAEHEKRSGVTYRVLRTKTCRGEKAVYKAYYRCQHNTYPNSHQRVKSPSPKHTGCQALIKVSIQPVSEARKFVYKRDIQTTHPAVVEVHHNHNHELHSADALKYKDVSEDCKKKFLELFKNNYGPAKCLEIHKQDLMKEYKENYFLAAADRSICPDSQWVYRLYYASLKKDSGGKEEDLQKNFSGAPDEKAETSERILEDIVESVLQNSNITSENNTNDRKNFGDENIIQSWINIISSSDINAKMEVIGNDFVIAICTPLMERVHSLDPAHHNIFIDSSGNMEQYKCQIFLLLTDSDVGGLPLGLIISSSRSEEVFTCALNLFKKVLPIKAFSSQKFPKAFVIDNCVALQKSLQASFPNSSIMLCPFYLLQATWQWLCDVVHQIDDLDRQELYYLFKNVLLAENNEDFNSALFCLRENCTGKKHNNFLNYAESLLDTCAKWGLTFGQDIHGNGTKNVVESALNVLKDRVLNCIRADSIKQLFNYFIVSMSNFYATKILDIISGQCNNNKNVRYIPNRRKIKNMVLIKENNNVYTVKNNHINCHYEINSDLGLCSCPVGMNGQICKHQHFLAIKQSYINVVTYEESSRKSYYWIATGSENLPKNWCVNMNVNSQEKSVSLSLEDFDDRSISSLNENPSPDLEDGNVESLTSQEETNLHDLDVSDESIDSQSMEHNSLDTDFVETATQTETDLFGVCNYEDFNNLLKDFLLSFEERFNYGFQNNPQEFISALENMQNQLEKMETDSAFLSAMQGFGKVHKQLYTTVEDNPVSPTSLNAQHNKHSIKKYALQEEPIKEHQYSKQKVTLGNRVHPYQSKSDVLNWLQHHL